MSDLKPKTPKQKVLEDILAILEGALVDIENAMSQIHEDPDFDPIKDHLGHLYKHAENVHGSATALKGGISQRIEVLEKERIIPPEPEPEPDVDDEHADDPIIPGGDE